MDVNVVRGVGLSVYLTSLFQRSANPPLRSTLGTTSIEGKLSSSFMGCISVTDNFVSMRNKIVGPFFLTRSVST